MSIFPATDIVSDVARAADPQKAQAAFARLSAMAAARSVTGAQANFQTDAAPQNARLEREMRTIISASPPPQIQTLTATQKFEAFLVQSWLENLLPKEESGIFGSDPGANVWRSMMAEQLGAKLASTDCLGLQKLLEPKGRAAAHS